MATDEPPGQLPTLGVSRAREREAIKLLPRWQPEPSDSSDEHVPVSSPDTALNAFAQLIALRLNVDRALVSLIDGEDQYILAEGTRTISLQLDDRHENDDGLLLGMVTIPRRKGLCENALNMTGSHDVWVVPNIHDDAVLCSRNFTINNAKIKFYAACPILIRGLTTGILCLYDRNSRESLQPSQKDFLSDMAATIGQHLEAGKLRRNHERSLQLFVAMDSLMKGPPHSEPNVRELEPHLDLKWSFSDLLPRVPEKSTAGHNSVMPGHGQDIVPPDRAEVIADDKSNSNKKGNTKKQKPEVSSTAHGILQRASELLRRGFDADGVIFYDVGGSAFRQDAAQSSASSTNNISSDSDYDSLSDHTAPSNSKKNSEPCGIFAASASQRAGSTSPPTLNMRKRDLKAFLHKYPKGKSFYIDHVHISPGSGDESTAPEGLSYPADKPATYERRNPRKVGQSLSRAFPGARSAVFFPLWDSRRERWYSAGIAYSNSQRRLMFDAEDLRFISAFSLCIMGELARRDAKLAELQKDTFVSMISHELRSPLHGILANIELLRDARLSAFQTTLLDTIDGCGHSLLDVVNHLLDHTAMVSIDGKQRKDGSHKRRISRMGSHNIHNENTDSSQSEIQRLVDIDLVAVTEEIISGLTSEMQLAADVRQGYESNNGLKSPLKQDLNRSHAVMVYDIVPKDQWVLRVKTGAFRRILANLAGNSIKFTQEGTIKVSLHRSDPEGDSTICGVTLTIADTGCGISEQFQHDHLFKKFRQENTHSVGSGLGLSIVKSIVEELNGTVDIQSEKDKGTVATVKFPCELVVRAPPPDGSKPLEHLNETVGRVRESCKGLTIRFVVANTLGGDGQAIDSINFSRNSVANICSEWLKLKVEYVDHLSSDPDYIYVLDQGYLQSKSFREMQDEIERVDDLSASNGHTIPPTIFIGAANFVASLHKDPTFRAGESLFFITNPCGPHQVARIISLCLRYMPSVSYTPIESTSASRVSESSPRPFELDTETQQVALPLPLLGKREQLQTQQNSTEGRNPDNHETPAEGRSREESRAQVSGDLSQGTHVSIPQLAAVNHPAEEAKGFQPEPPAASSAAPITDGRSTPMMMLVEDNTINMKILELSTKRMKLPYSLAFDGSQAVDLFSVSPLLYDVIWMDIMMPTMSGIVATEHIRAIEKKMNRAASKPPARIIALTGLSGAEIEGDASACGMDAFFTKPIKFGTLKESVESWVREVGEKEE